MDMAEAQQQKKRTQSIVSITVIVLVVILYFIFWKHQHVDKRENAFRHTKIEYTEHAKCRMDCRHISEKEIKDVLREGEINYRKTEKNASPCPKYALEYYTDGKKVRVIVGDCDERAVIITVIDLDHEFECNCPGDKEK